MSLLVDAIYATAGALSAPWWLYRAARDARFRRTLRDRWGRGPARAKPPGAARIWVHCASVGEINGARTFMDALPRRFPELDWVVSTCTETGREQARARYGEERVFLLPLDFSLLARRSLLSAAPDVLVIVESEIWPNLLQAARHEGVALLWINGRIQEKALRRWRPFRSLLGFSLDAATRNRYCIQTESYAARFRELGVPEAAIRVTGNMKFDAVPTAAPTAQRDALRQAFALPAEARLLVGGSTWPGEEELLLAAYAELRQEMPDLRLLLAPRHTERSGDVARTIERAGFACARRSRTEAVPASADAVLLLDTIGELVAAYSLAAVAFVGKTLAVGGGHNVLEPAALGVPPVFGPLTANCEAEAALLTEHDAGRRVNDGPTLTAALRQLLRDPALRAELGRRGREAVRGKQGATERNLAALAEQLACAGKSI